LNWRTQSNCSY